MNAKREGLNPAIILRDKSIAAKAVPIIRDKHQVHHKNLGGPVTYTWTVQRTS